MALSLLGLIPKVLKTVAGIVGGGAKLEDVANALAGNTLPPEQRIALEQAMMVHEKEMRQLDLDEMRAVLSESLTMIQSPDKYVSRARPTGLYAAYAGTVALIIALIAGVSVDPAAILTLMGPLYGAQGYYMHLRTREKLESK